MKRDGRVSGLGIDIVKISKIRKLAERNKRFLTRNFTPEEIRYCLGKKRKWQHLAVRFAAKEAVWKAVGPDVSLKDISIRNAPSGKPEAQIKSRNRRNRILVSLSHSDHYAAAVAIIL